MGLLNTLSPKFAKRRLREMFDERIRDERECLLRSIPLRDLTGKHVAQLRALETRERLLEELPMKADGIVAGHDYSMGNWKDDIKYGVIEAVHEFCVNCHWELIYLTTELSTNPSFAIRKLPTQ